MIMLQQNSAQLSCPVQNFVAITLLDIGWEQNEIFHHIWIVMEKLLVKWYPGEIQVSTNSILNNPSLLK